MQMQNIFKKKKSLNSTSPMLPPEQRALIMKKLAEVAAVRITQKVEEKTKSALGQCLVWGVIRDIIVVCDLWSKTLTGCEVITLLLQHHIGCGTFYLFDV